MIYREWIWTIRNWPSVAIPGGIALLIIAPRLMNDASFLSADPYVPLALLVTITAATSGRLQADLQTGIGAIYLRTPIHPYLQILTKWAFDSGVGILAAGLAILAFASQGRSFSTLDLFLIAVSSAGLTATNMALVAFAPRVAGFARMFIFIFAFGTFGRAVPIALAVVIPPLAAFSGIASVASGNPSLSLALILAIQTALLLGVMASLYRWLLLRRL